ncbi:MAG: hypothetical protein K0R69_2023 [Clostridia bacterium]|nr:hypothetical protein [Clostridia bacterium]
MRTAKIYEVNLFWRDKSPIESTKGSYVEEQVTRFLVLKTIEQVKELPLSIQKQIFSQLIEN